MPEEKEFKKPFTVEDVKARADALVKAAMDEALTTPRPEVAEPYEWWNLYGYGPIQNFAPDGPLPPSQLIKMNQTAYVVAVLVLNPFPILPPAPGMSPCQVLSNFSLPFEIRYQTANVSTWALGGPSGVHPGNLVPGQCWYTDVLEFTATQEGIFEMNILARILGAVPPGTTPQFAGFARWIGDFDPEAFWPGPTPGWHFELPIKFMVYA